MSLIERIKEEIDLEACLEHFGADVPAWRSRPFNVRCFLPGHDDMNPSMTIYPQEGRAWCHGCNRGGDVLDITSLFLQRDMREAVAYWAGRLGITPSPPTPGEARRARHARTLREIRQRCHNFSHAIERGMPKPLDPDMLSAWDACYAAKDYIDGKTWRGGGPRDKAEAVAYIEELKRWRRLWEGLLAGVNGGAWGGAVKSRAIRKTIPRPQLPLHSVNVPEKS